MKRWILRILGGLLAVVVLGLGTIYALSAQTINARHTFREWPLAASTDSASRARGEHIARMSCFGCHGDSLQGQVFYDQPGIARLVAPNALAILDTLTDAEFAGFLRNGVRKDGTSSFVMPPAGFYHIAEADVAALIGYLRSLPKAATPQALPRNSYGPLGRMGIAMGEFKPIVAQIDTTAARVGDDPAWSTTRQGEYLARIICANCHGPRLTGDPATPSPSIVAAAAYDPGQFVTLLRTGTPRDTATKFTMMGDVARAELKHLTDEEISAIYAYLKTLPATGVK